MNRTAPTSNRQPNGAIVYGALGLLILLSVAGNLYWLQQNVVQLGHDASAHLSRTLKMAAAMSEATPVALLRGLTVTDFRPPGLYLAAQPFYWLLGPSLDSAQLANVAIMALIVLFTFLLARTVLAAQPPRTRDALALLAAALASLLPMLLAMSRLFYAETLVALCVVAGLYFLLKSEGFARRPWCLALGAALGVGMLAKWTLPVYLAAPLLLAAWHARDWLLGRFMRAPMRGSGQAVAASGGGGAGATPVTFTRSRLLRLAGAVLAAAAVALLLYWPDRDYWAQTLLGEWLLPVWFGVWLALFVLLALPSRPLTNLLAALALGAAIAGLWYLPQAGFAFTLSEVAFGTGEGDYKPANWLSQNQYTRYFRFFYQHHTGLLIALAILPAGLLPWLAALRSRPIVQPTAPHVGVRTGQEAASVGAGQAAGSGAQWAPAAGLWRQPGVLLLWAAALSPFLILIFTSQTSSRNLVPILPLFAVIVAVALLAYPVRWRGALAALWLGVLLLHWALATFDGLSGLRTQTDALWPGQEYSVAPASGVTDPGYWIVPDVLAQIAASSTATTTLGVLLDTAPLHPGSFEYPILAQRLPIDLASLNGPDLRGARDVVTNQWILVKDGDNGEMKAPQQAMAAQLLEGAPWFSALYTLVKSYPLPNSETAWLYRRDAGPPDPYQFSTIIGQDVPAVAATVNHWWSEGATLAFATPETAVWVGTQDIPLAQAILPRAGADLQPGDLAGAGRSLIVVSRYRTPDFQQWLGQQFRYIDEVHGGEFTATLYGHVDHPLTPLAAGDPAAAWGPLRLTSLQSWPQVAPGDPLPLDFTLAGTPASELDGRWKVSARLLAPDGAVVAQQDTAALPGPLALTLFVPPGAPPGDYTLHFVVYNGETLAPVADIAGQPSTPLAVIEVRSHRE